MIPFEELCAALDPLQNKAIGRTSHPSAHAIPASSESPTLDLDPHAPPPMDESEEAYGDAVGELDLQDVSPLDEASN